jgi:response regulator RpfG family c-di-GMP phosphodiesterase
VARILFVGSGEAPVETYREGLSRDFHQLVLFEVTDDLPERIKESRVDLILVDLESLQPRNRDTLLGYLSNPQVTQTIPVIVVTDDTPSALCLLSSAFVLQKPVSMQTLRDTIHGTLRDLPNHSEFEGTTGTDQVCGRQIAPHQRSKSAGLFQEPGEPICPFFKKATADWLYPVTGYCQGRADGKLMIPSIAEYRELCTTEHFPSCENYQNKRRLLHDVVD